MTLILPEPAGKPRPPATVLQGPADADAFRVKVGRYKERFYCDPLPACPIAEATDETWPSVSRIKGAKPFEGANYVAMKRIAYKMAEGWLPRSVEYVKEGDHYDGIYDELKSIDRLGLQAAGKRGTHVHKMAEQMLYGQPVTAEGPGAEYRGALEDFFAAYQPELVAAEVVCINRLWQYGGTADAIVRIDGKTYLVDWKSRSADADHAAYAEEGAQLAAYAMADYIVVQDRLGRGAVRAPFPAIDGILILSVKPDGVKVYPVDQKPAERYFVALHAWYLARQTEDAHIGKPWPTKRATAAPAPYVPPVAPAAEPAKTAVKPDEGGPVDERDVAALRKAFESQPANRLAAVVAVTKACAALGLSASVTQSPTGRRFEIARGLMAWSRFTDGDDPWHELLRTLVRIATGLEVVEQPGVDIGDVVGSMDWQQATRFAQAACLLAEGGALGFDPAGSPVVLPVAA